MGKFYFIADDDEYCYTKKYWQQYMKDHNISSLKLFEAERETGVDYFFCKEFFEVGLKKESGCGSDCIGYKPRNGKNGRCTHSGYCYVPNDNKIVLLNSEQKDKRSVATKMP